MMAQIEEENIANKPKLDFFSYSSPNFFQGGGTKKMVYNFEKWGKIRSHKKYSEILKNASVGLFLNT